MTIFAALNEVEVDEKARELARAVHAIRRGVATAYVLPEREASDFQFLPGSPLAYWLPQRLFELYVQLPKFKDPELGRDAKCGMGTLDDFRFLRLSWEVAHRAEAWTVYFGGGTFSPVYEDFPLLVHWASNGYQLKTFVEDKVGSASRKIQSEGYYFQAGIVFPRRTRAFCPKCMPSGGIFSNSGQSAFLPVDSLTAGIAVLGSAACGVLITISQGTTSQERGGTNPQFEVGQVKNIPWPDISREDSQVLDGLVRRIWKLKRLLDTTNETSHAFVLPPGTLGYEASPLHPEAGGFNRADIHRELAEIQAEIDDKVFALYGISDEDRATIEASMSRGASRADTTEGADDESSDEEDDSDEDDSESSIELTATTLTTYSWLVGVAFGRFDPRLATRKRAIPPEPEPFDPLPARSPGMWPEGEQPDTVPPDIMVDDPGHDHDIRMLVANAAAMTGWPDPDDLRQWLAKEFFPLHIKMYSKSRRKAPIYWQLATPSASYSVWLYIHAFTKDTLFRVQNDYVAPKLAHEQRKLESLQAASQEGQTAAERKELAAQESLVEELRAFLDEVKRVAPLWNPNLDDGVIINFSLLWRLVPQHKPWQKELKSTWDALCAGKYDWAHLAMHLWPERVVLRCAQDRSLAIAHGLEEVFWVEGSDGKWTARKEPTKPVLNLVAERRSPAVQDALKQLLNAPSPTLGGARKKAPRRKASHKPKLPKKGEENVQ